MNQSEIINSIIKKKVIPSFEKSFSENLSSVIVYGSVASNNYNRKFSDINILILLKENDPEAIIKFGNISSKDIKQHRLTPLVLTEKEFSSSADVFPMEYNDIRDNYILIYGKDPVKNLKLTDKNLRHQTEASLRGIINQMRQLLIATKGKKRAVYKLSKKIAGTIESALRASLRLKKIDISNFDRKEVITKTAEIYNLNMEAALKLIDPDINDIIAEVSSILLFLSELTNKIDKMDI